MSSNSLRLMLINLDSCAAILGGAAIGAGSDSLAEVLGTAFPSWDGGSHGYTTCHLCPERAIAEWNCRAPHPPDTAVDVWALGMVLHWPHTGQDYLRSAAEDGTVLRQLCDPSLRVGRSVAGRHQRPVVRCRGVAHHAEAESDAAWGDQSD
ncbi:unnamed protein product [Phaeothamnion confervicola]